MKLSNLFVVTMLLVASSVAFAGKDSAGDRAADRAMENAMAEEIGTDETPTQEPARAVASDFTNDYLDSVKDEQAAEATIAQKDSADHDKFLRSMKEGRRDR